jgi:hydroxyquinol 1,2-dioxygenase
VGGDRYLKGDAVFGVKDSLVAPFERLVGQTADWRSKFDFVMLPS